MEDLLEKVIAQGKEIDKNIRLLKETKVRMEAVKGEYFPQEYDNKTSILEGIIEVLEGLKINI